MRDRDNIWKGRDGQKKRHAAEAKSNVKEASKGYISSPEERREDGDEVNERHQVG